MLGQAKEFKGVTLSGACFQHAYTNVLQELLPDFEARTGMRVVLADVWAWLPFTMLTVLAALQICRTSPWRRRGSTARCFS